MTRINIIYLTVIAFICACIVTIGCKKEKDPCIDLKCYNAGVCSGGVCNCTVGYEGTNCEIFSRDKFVGPYKGNRLCSGLTGYNPALSFYITNGSETNMFKIINGPDTNCTCIMTGKNSFKVTKQGLFFLSGSGYIENNKLTFTFQMAYGFSVTTCTFEGTKQL